MDEVLYGGDALLAAWLLGRAALYYERDRNHASPEVVGSSLGWLLQQRDNALAQGIPEYVVAHLMEISRARYERAWWRA